MTQTALWLGSLLVEIHATFGTPLDLAVLARRSGMSPYHLHRVFREHTGETPRQHIERLRLERAFLRWPRLKRAFLTSRNPSSSHASF